MLTKQRWSLFIANGLTRWGVTLTYIFTPQGSLASFSMKSWNDSHEELLYNHNLLYQITEALSTTASYADLQLLRSAQIVALVRKA